MVYCKRCKKEILDNEVVLTQADVAEGRTTMKKRDNRFKPPGEEVALTQKDIKEGKSVESQKENRVASGEEEVLTQADVDARKAKVRGPIGGGIPAEAKDPEEPTTPAETPKKKKAKKKK
jgi:hypothetical protein